MPASLKVVIVGGGLVGLAAACKLASSGHIVTVLERRSALSMAGGDIQISPNGVSAVSSMGLGHIVSRVANPRRRLFLYTTGNPRELLNTPIDLKGVSPSWMCRRVDLSKAFYDAAISAGATILFSCDVTSVDDMNTSVTLSTGVTLAADLIVGADGVDSTMRALAFPKNKAAIQTLDRVCHQWYTPYSVMAEDPQTLALWEKGKQGCGVVCGNGNYITFWTNEKANSFFVVTTQTGYKKHVSVGNWTQSGDPEELKALYSGYCEPFSTVIAKATYCDLWRTADTVGEPAWLSDAGRTVLIGDAIHAMPPDAAQGLSQGLEDVAALAAFLDTASSANGVPGLLRDFVAMRKRRVDRVLSGARNNSKLFSLRPGPMRDARDAAWKSWIPDDQLMQAYELAPVDPDADASDVNYVKWVISYDVLEAVNGFVKSSL